MVFFDPVEYILLNSLFYYPISSFTMFYCDVFIIFLSNNFHLGLALSITWLLSTRLYEMKILVLFVQTLLNFT